MTEVKGSESDMIIDLGNTRMKIALFVNGRLDGVLTFSKRAYKQVERLLENTEAKRGILSNVSNLNEPLDKIIRDKLNIIEFNSKTRIPITLDYKTPNTLGTDRIANAVGAYKLYPKKNVLVIDFGTCIKYDVVTSEGVYLGGSIAPGVQMRLKSMHKMTGKLPRIKEWRNRDEDWPGKDTKSSMVSGVIQGIHAEILRYMEVASEHHPNLVTVATGGDFAFFDKAFKNIIFASPYLTLVGLHEILLYNQA